MSFNPSGSVSGENNLSYLNQEDEVKPIVVRAQRAPLATDRRYKIGTLWVDQGQVTGNPRSWQMVAAGAGQAFWVLLGQGGSDLEELSGDSGSATPDAGGAIQIAGGTNITTAAAGNAVTANLDTNITLTSVDSGTFTTSDPADGLTITSNGITADGANANIAISLFPKGSDNVNIATGSVSLKQAGGGIELTEGANARMGVATLVAGTVTVANTSVTATTRIFLTSQADGGTPGFLRITSVNAGVDFTITSSNAADTSTVAWMLVEGI